MKNSVVMVGMRLGVFLASLAVSVQTQAAEITVFNRGIQTLLDTAWGRFGVLIATLMVVFLGFKLVSGRFDAAHAIMIIFGVLLIWGAVEVLNSFL